MRQTQKTDQLMSQTQKTDRKWTAHNPINR
jgi:hypothetical protein